LRWGYLGGHQHRTSNVASKQAVRGAVSGALASSAPDIERAAERSVPIFPLIERGRY
jgi:hypothetical protein